MVVRPHVLVRALVLLLCVSGLSLEVTGARAGQTLYVGVPSVEAVQPDSRVSVLVFDIDAGHRFVKRIPLWPSDTDAENVRGLATGPGGTPLYVSTTRRLGAVDPQSGRILWEGQFGDHCCDRIAVSPDGRTLYAPAFGRPVWYVIEAVSGRLLQTVDAIGWPRSTAVSPGGDRAYLAAWEWNRLLVMNTATRTVTTQIGPFGGDLCPFTINRRGSLAFVNIDAIVGFEVADLTTGQILDRVQVDGYSPAELAQFECPSNGIAFTPDERELWIADGVGNRLRAFDAKPYPPVEVASIPLTRQPRWVTFSRDGHYAYASTGDVIDVATRTIVATLTDEHGAQVESERVIAP
jgi:DNA-binding beta-propeller fold protein YncE